MEAAAKPSNPVTPVMAEVPMPSNKLDSGLRRKEGVGAHMRRLSRATASMPRPFKTLFVGLVAALFGVSLNAVSLGGHLEQRFGLPLLFWLRGNRPVSPEVLIVSLDKESADRFDLPPEPARWPRTLQAALINRLLQGGAAVITFDVVFEEPREEEQDAALEASIQAAGNVVLCEFVKQDAIPVRTAGDEAAGTVMLRHIVGPLPRFARHALALAPFPLPKVPISVSQYWLSKSELGDKPTLPVVALQVFGLRVYEEFLRLLRVSRPEEAAALPQGREQVIADRAVVDLIRTLRGLFARDESLADDLDRLMRDRSSDTAASERDDRLLRSLVRMYAAPESGILNFYGPPGFIPTVSAHQLIQSGDGPLPLDLAGKAVFIGVARHRTADQQDDFFTAFSKETGIDLTGVEIAATAFANLLEDRPVRPVPHGLQQLLLLVWGILTGVLCYRLRTRIAIPVLGLLAAVALPAAVHALSVSGHWLPVVVPLGVQVPVAFWNGQFWRHRDTLRERRNIQEAFGYFLPRAIVAQLAEDVANLRRQPRITLGTCLCTDGEQYASLAERCSPKDLIRFLNDYYETIFPLVQSHGGRVSDIIGDSMLAVWTDDASQDVLRERTCLAALDIAHAVDRFNASHAPMRLPTRIGVSFGPMSFGHIGGANHFEYRPVGDTVNIASRIEGLNKILGTRILVTEGVLSGLRGFRARELGSFLLAGKSMPVTIFELLGLDGESSPFMEDGCEAFARGLEAYRRRDWMNAARWFEQLLDRWPEDGPSRFYLSLCARFALENPDEDWDGSIRTEKGFMI